MDRRKFLGRFGLGFLAVPFGFKATKVLKEPVEVITFPDDVTTLAVDNFATMTTQTKSVQLLRVDGKMINATGTYRLKRVFENYEKVVIGE